MYSQQSKIEQKSVRQERDIASRNSMRMEANLPFQDKRAETLSQREIQAYAQTQTSNTFPLSSTPIQRKVDKYRAGAWFSTFDPYTTFWTKKEATDYDRHLKSHGRAELRARVPTLYTYTHTKPHNKLGHTLQGPHTVAHRVILQSLIDATTVPEVFKIFDDQILEPQDVEEIVFTDEAPPSGMFSKQIHDRLQRFVDDYEEIYDELFPMFTASHPDLITIKHLTNKLLNMDPYAVYSWKTTAKASQKSLSGKGESAAHPSWSDLYDTPPSSSFRSKPNLDSFVAARHDLFDQHF